MIVRDATDNDEPALLDMARQFYAAAGEPDGPFDLGHTVDLIRGVRVTGVLLVAEHAGAPVGMLAMLFGPGMCNPAQRAHELCLWVQPGRRGGTALLGLLREFERRAIERGAVGAQLSALTTSPPALRKVYERMGYAPADSSFSKRFGGS